MIKPAETGQKNALGFFRHDCRMCHSKNLEPFLDLGMQPHSDGFVKEEELSEPEHFFPLVTVLCKDCGHVQLTYVVDPEYLYGEQYIYESSITQTFHKHFYAMAADIVDQFKFPAGSLAVDIGSNVGLLLAGFKEKGMDILGIDPAPKIVPIANANGIETWAEFFLPETARKIISEKKQASVITATNVFAHIDDLDTLLKGINIALKADGIFVIEAPYWVDTVQKMLYDTIYHQHLSYLSIRPLQHLFNRFGMEVFDVYHNLSHGGSARIFVCKKGAHAVQPIVQELLDLEVNEGVHTIERLKQYAEEVSQHRQALTEMLVSLKDQGKTIVGIGAPAKGNTLLNYCSINKGILEFVTEKSTLKQGMYSPGTHIPIVGDEKLLEGQPDYGLILAWNFAEEIMRNLSEYKKHGGKFIIPMPSPTIV